MENILTNVEKINIDSCNHDYSSLHYLHYQEFNSVPRNYLVPNFDMTKFDGKDIIIWILQMDQLFCLLQVPNLQKVTHASLYLGLDQFLGTNKFVNEKRIILSLGPFL